MKTRTEKIEFYRRALGGLYGFCTAHREHSKKIDLDCFLEIFRSLDEIERLVKDGKVPDALPGKQRFPFWKRLLKKIGIHILFS